MQNYEQTNPEFLPQTPLNKEVLDNLPPSPNNPPWNSGIAFLAWLASVSFIVVLPLLIVIPYLKSQNINLSDGQKLTEFATTDPTTVMLQISAVLPAHLLTILLAWLIITNYNKYSFFEMIGWKWGGFKLWHVLAIVVVFFGLAVVLPQIFGNPENHLTQMLKVSTSIVYVVAFMATFTAPMVEEVIYRGILYSSFQRSFGIYWAVGITTLLFAIVHVPQYKESPATIIMIFLLSLALTLIRVKTSNLLPCIVVHTVLNGIQSVAMVAETFIKPIEKTVEQVVSFIHILK